MILNIRTNFVSNY